MLQLENIDAIIFDLGNVIIDIDYEVMLGEFREIAAADLKDMVSYTHQDSVFDRFERGEVSAVAFRTALRPYLRPDATDEAIDQAWNAILIHYPPAKFELLKKLRKRYKVFALSNINELHAAAIDAHVSRTFGVSDMQEYFDRAYYSHEMGHRKPEPEIYQMIMAKEKLDPARTLFIDDKAENIAAAAVLGIQTYHLTDRDALVGLFDHMG